MNSDHSREKIKEQIREEVLNKVQENLEKLLSEKVKEVELLLEQTSQTILSGNIETALENYVNEIRKILPDEDKKELEETDLIWWQYVRELTERELVELVVLEQEEGRFKRYESDPIILSLGKWVKRSTRAFQSGTAKVGNSIRSLFKKREKAPKTWKQKVPLKSIVELNLLDISGWIQDWRNELRKIQAEALLEADARTLHASGLIKPNTEDESDEEQNPDVEQPPTRDDIEDFFEEACNEVKALKGKYSDKLDTLLQNIENEIQYAVSVTGTIERAESEYSEEKIIAKEKGILQRKKQDQESWNILLNALVNRCSLSMDFIELYQLVAERVEGFHNSLEEFFSVHIESQVEKLNAQIQQAIAIFNSSEEDSMKEIRENSGLQREKMKEHIDHQLLKPLREFVEDATLGTKFHRFTSAIPEWTKSLSEKAVLVEKLDMTVMPPTYEFEKVDWQSLVQRVTNNQLAKEFLPKEVKPEEFLLEIVKELQEISQIIYTNLEIADEVKKSDEEEPFEVALEGIKRAETKLNELEVRIGDKKRHLGSKLKERQQTAFSKLAMLLEKQDVSEVRLAGAEYMAKETAVDWKTKLQVKWAIVEEKAELIGRFIWKKTKTYYKNIQKFMGFAEKEKLEGDKTDLATFLSETNEQIATLPFIYRRLFDFNKEVDDRFYIRRSEQFERFKKAYDLWQNEFPSTCAIVGEKGAGKSIFIRLMMKEVFTKHDVVEINFTDTIWQPDKIIQKIAGELKIKDPESLEGLIDSINRKKKRIVVILENIQNCYIRNISGFEALEQLMYLISETNKNILWVTSSTRYGWLFLDKVMNVGDYFTHAVEADNLTGVQIKDLVLRRHMASGYQLRFLPDEATKKSRSYKKVMDDEEKKQEHLREKYFDKLSKLSEGNPSIAMIYWIRSIKEFDDTHFYISPFEFGAIRRIDELDSNELFCLAAYVLHDSLNTEELTLIVHKPLRECKLTISRLTSQSILIKNEHGFELNQLIYRQVVRVLKEANYIH